MDIYKSGKLANDYYYCQKRPNIAPKSKILEEKFENVVKGRIKQFGVGEVLQFPSLPLWGNLESRQNTDKISK